MKKTSITQEIAKQNNLTMAKSIIDIIENNGGLCTEGIMDSFVECISDGEKPTLLFDDIISNIEEIYLSATHRTLDAERARSAAQYYWKSILEKKYYWIANTGDATDYIDFIRSYKMVEHGNYRILEEDWELYHLYQTTNGVEKKIGDYKGTLKLDDIDADINTILESLNK